MFFLSSVHHRTIPFTTDTNRIIFSFDLMQETAKYEVMRLTPKYGIVYVIKNNQQQLAEESLWENFQAKLKMLSEKQSFTH